MTQCCYYDFEIAGRLGSISKEGEAMETVAVLLAAIGAINWGLIGLFGFDLVAAITTAGKFGETNVVSRIIYVVVGVAGVWALFTLGG